MNTAWKVSKYGDFSSPCFPLFGLNTEIYSKSPHSVQIQENTDKKKKIRIRTFGAVEYIVIGDKSALLPTEK